MAFVLPLAATAATAFSGLLGTGAAVAGTAAAGAGAAAAGGLSLGSVLGLGSTLLGAVGQIQSGNAQKATANYNAQVNEIQARQAQDQGVAQATEISKRTQQKLAGTRAAAGESGLELTGSVADVLSEVNKQGTLDAMTAMSDSSNRAASLRSSAALSKSRGDAAQSAGYLGAGQSLLTGFSRLYTV